MKEINYGKVNDLSVYAVLVDGKLIPLTKKDLKFEKPDCKINYDSGVYPSITDVPQYICNQVMINKMF